MSARAAEAEVRHGYTLDDLDRIARSVLRGDRWPTAGDIRERYNAVWHGIAEHLVAAEAPPTETGLFGAGLRASDAHVRAEMHHHGRSSRDIGEAMGAFERYWTALPTSSPEDRVVDRLALAQIWPQLTPGERKALAALAWLEDYALAADACGVAEGTFRVQISMGRRKFLKAWHEGETPSRVWRIDKRRGSRDGLDRNGNQRLTASQLDALRDRYNAGETQTALAAQAGVNKGTLSKLLRGTWRAAPDREAP